MLPTDPQLSNREQAEALSPENILLNRYLQTVGYYRFAQQLESEGRWTEAEELVADLDRQHAEDPELELTYDMLGTNPSYQPRAQASEGVGARWTFGPPA